MIHHKPTLIRIGLILILAFWIAGSGCTSTERRVLPAPTMLKKAREEIKHENYEEAQESLTQLMEDSPDSKERILAQLLLAEVHYRQEQWEEAKFNFNRFVELYPAHKLAPRAQYLKAMTDFRQVDLAIRDQSFTHGSKAEFEKLVQIYPKSPYAKKAQAKIQECVDQLAENQMEVGRYYYRTNAFQSAIIRFKAILEEFPKQKFRDEVIYLLGESYFEEESFEEARTYFKKLLKEHPRSEYRQDARARLRELR